MTDTQEQPGDSRALSMTATPQDMFGKLQTRIADLYPVYRGWNVYAASRDGLLVGVTASVDTITDDLLQVIFRSDDREEIKTTLTQNVAEVNFPPGYIAVFLLPPESDIYSRKAPPTPVMVLVPTLLLVDPANTRPKLNMQMLLDRLEGEPYYVVLPGTRTTMCVLQFKSGTTATGSSSCMYIENFDWEMGKQLAYKRALDNAFEILAGIVMMEDYLAELE